MLKIVLLLVFSPVKFIMAGDPPTRDVDIVRFDLLKGKGFSKVCKIVDKVKFETELF